MAAHEPDHSEGSPEGGPVKTFLEHLEDFRWMLIKSVAALFLGILVCLCAANVVVGIIKWPLKHASVGFSGTNQIAVVSFGTNQLGNFQITPEERQSFNLGTNRFVAVTIEPLTLGTNQVLGWRVNDDPAATADAQRMKIELVNLSPAG